jgi:kynurenine formamidase
MANTKARAIKPKRKAPSAPARPKSRPRPARAELKLPSYAALPVRAGAPAGAAWGVFGDDDEVGTINLLTPQRVRQAAANIRTGKVFPLNLPINIPDPPLFGRGKHVHKAFPFPGAEAIVADDCLDNFYPQASSQWDALCHVKHPLGAYNGVPDNEMAARGGSRLGIDNLARRGIAGRGVLADIARHYKRRHKTIDFTRAGVILLEDLEATLAEQKTRLRAGDILVIRIGWTQFYLQASPELRADLARETRVPGIEGTPRVAQWIWDHHLAAIAADSPALEALPKEPGDPNFLHFHLLGLFGMPIGEMWNLEDLAADCAADRRYEFFLTSAPLNIPGGVGSPPNALAIK